MDTDWPALLTAYSPDALIVTASDGTVLCWSGSATTIFGYTQDQACGRSLADLIIPRHEDGPAHDLDGLETVRQHSAGHLVYVNASVQPLNDESGMPVRFLHRYTDITLLKVRRDANLIDTRYRDLTDSMPDAIVIVNDTGRILQVNRQAQSLFGVDRHELLGHPIEALLPQRFRRHHVGHRNAYMSRSRTRPMGVGLELFGLRKNGQEFPVEISLSPLESEVGPLVISAIRDISERKRIERTLQEKNIELERASKAKDSFLASMSHELRTPLNAIIGFTGLMLMKLPGPLTADQERQLAAVQSSGKHLLSLINDLLDLAKIESGRVDIALEPVVWQSVVVEVETALRPLAEAKGLALYVDLPGHDVVVATDRRALHQILVNMVSNAIKYTPSGSVQIGLVQRASGPTLRTELSVEDTGVGISPADQDNLFQAFSQVGSSGRSIEGTGLGLYLCRKLADLLGGRIELDSAPGQGSRFTFSISSRHSP